MFYEKHTQIFREMICKSKFIFFLQFIVVIIFNISCKTIEKKPPPGTVRLNDSLYIDKYPVTNIDYREFLSCIETYWSPRVSDSIQNLKPYGLSGRNFIVKPGLWGVEMKGGTDKLNEKEPYDITKPPFYGDPDSLFFQSMMLGNFKVYDSLLLYEYITHQNFRDFPVVYISRKQADAYCKWRTDMVKILYSVTIEDSVGYLEKYIPIIKYRLPTAKEWSTAYQKLGYNFEEDEELLEFLKSDDEFFPLFEYSTVYRPFQVFPSSISEIVADGHIGYGWDDNLKNYNRVDTVRNIIGTGSSFSFRCICEVEK